jgi:hypothetical protein
MIYDYYSKFYIIILYDYWTVELHVQANDLCTQLYTMNSLTSEKGEILPRQSVHGDWDVHGDWEVQELYTVYLTRFRTYKIALPPQTKT